MDDDRSSKTSTGGAGTETTEPPALLDSKIDTTETIDFNKLWGAHLTESGSFNLGGVRSTSLGKLLYSLPIPVLLIDREGDIILANKACGKISPEYPRVEGGPFISLFRHPHYAAKAQEKLDAAFATRKPVVTEGLLQIEDNSMWGRMHFRSIRLGSERMILFLVEDLTPEKRQLLVEERHSRELQRMADELNTTNRQLMQEIAERKRAEEGLKESLKVKEVLMREIHHRVKNNLQVISSLLRLQSRHVPDDTYRHMIQDSERRLQSMAIIHEKLYRSDDFAGIDYRAYVQSLAASLFDSFGVEPDRIRFACSAPPTWLSVDAATPCGLIAYELLANALKHAFPDNRRGTISVALDHLGHGTYRLTIADDGIGLPAGFDLESSETVGLRLLQTLIKQLRATLEVKGQPGASFAITFHDVDFRASEPDE
jgi:two-component sensor histidine kinase